MVKRGLVILCLLLLVVPLATAGIFDWFKEKVQFGPQFNVSISLGNVAPEILTILNVTDLECDGTVGSTTPGLVLPVPGTDVTC
ncbi:MAG: hypothetical protein ABIB79_00425, partial [archaeon]